MSNSMVFPSGETSSDSQVPSSVVNSTLRSGLRGRVSVFFGSSARPRPSTASRHTRIRFAIGESSNTSLWIAGLELELDPELGFHLGGGDHFDGVPGAAVEERSVRTLTRALLAADAELRVHHNAA